MPRSAKDYVRAYKRIYENADAEGRDLTPAESERVVEYLEAAKKMKAIEDRERELGATANTSVFSDPSRNSSTGGPGDIFVQSKGFQAVRMSDMRPQQWSTGPIEVMGPPALMAKGTLLESNTGGPGGVLTPPSYQPGVVSKLLEPLGVADVFGQSQTTASQVRYVVETVATNAAAGVAEAGLKPESTLDFDETWRLSARLRRSCRRATS
jgi:HK97 family phage major capsid protein